MLCEGILFLVLTSVSGLFNHTLDLGCVVQTSLSLCSGHACFRERMMMRSPGRMDRVKRYLAAASNRL